MHSFELFAFNAQINLHKNMLITLILTACWQNNNIAITSFLKVLWNSWFCHKCLLSVLCLKLIMYIYQWPILIFIQYQNNLTHGIGSPPSPCQVSVAIQFDSYPLPLPTLISNYDQVLEPQICRLLQNRIQMFQLLISTRDISNSFHQVRKSVICAVWFVIPFNHAWISPV
jgi:hypothetical protein